MKINLIKITKEALIDKRIIIKKLNNDKLRINYKNVGKRTSNHFNSFILPKEIILNIELSELIGLYLGDGITSKDSEYNTNLISKDIDIAKFVYTCFKKIFEIPDEKISLNLNYKHENLTDLIQQWSKGLEINNKKLKIHKVSNKSKYKSSKLRVQINSIIFRKIFQTIIEKYLDEIIKNKKLRRGFLRGYFAAEGTMSYNKKTRILSSISFSYNSQKEKWLRNLCMDCLKKEGINSNYNENPYKKDGKIIISNWKNYEIMHNINLFDRCTRKKKLFFELINRPKIYCYLKKHVIKKLFNNTLTQQELAIILKSTQGNISETIRGKRPLEINQIISLCNLFNKNTNMIKRNINKLQIYHSKTKIKPSKEFVNTIFNLKNPYLLS